MTWDTLRSHLEGIFSRHADRTAFVRGDTNIEFQVVAKVIDVMDSAGISSVGLLTPQLEKAARLAGCPSQGGRES